MRYALWLLLLSAAFGQTLDKMSEEQIKARAMAVRINEEKDAHMFIPLQVPDRLYLDGQYVKVARDETKYSGSCQAESGIHLSPYLRAESTRHVLWHEVKHYCLNRCTHSISTDWATDLSKEDAVIESTNQCELDALRDNPHLLEFQQIGRDLPAVQKMRKHCVISWPDGNETTCQQSRMEKYFTCLDPSIPQSDRRVLQVSESGKYATCHLPDYDLNQ